MKINYFIKLRSLFISLFVISLSFSVHAQDWQCFYPGKTAFYLNDSGSYRAVRFDSVSTGTEGTSYWTFKSFNKNDNQCSSGDCFSLGPSWTGSHMLADAAGNNFFFNTKGDSLCFNTLKTLDESWIFSRLGGDTVIEAYISALAEDTIFGVIDPVRVISFRTLTGGTVINGTMDALTMRLSMHYGLISTIDLYAFDPSIPSMPLIFRLDGISDLPDGGKNLTKREIFDYQHGDEFHTLLHTWSGWWDDVNTYSVKKVVSADWIHNPVADSVIYTLSVFSKIVTTTKWESVTSYLRNTEIQKYPFSHQENTDLLPGEGISGYLPGQPETWYAYQFEQTSKADYHFRRVKSLPERNQCSGDCIKEEYYNNDGARYLKGSIYIEGCGEYPYESMVSGDNVQGRHNSLVYFSKNTEVWGTPYDTTSWQGPHSTGEKEAVSGVELFPNPATDRVRIRLPFDDLNNIVVSVFSPEGMEVMKIQPDQQTMILPVDRDARGFYIVRVLREGRLVASKKLILL